MRWPAFISGCFLVSLIGRPRPWMTYFPEFVSRSPVRGLSVFLRSATVAAQFICAATVAASFHLALTSPPLLIVRRQR